MNNLTALFSAFSRIYHNKINGDPIYYDPYSKLILTNEEYELISNSLIKGISFFNPTFIGSDFEALRWIVDNQLCPSVLGRSSFCEHHLLESINNGVKQYVIYASGYDMSIFKHYHLDIDFFEIDQEEMIIDKINRLNKNNINYDKVNFIKCDFTNRNWSNFIKRSKYNPHLKSFSSLLGISYYLTKDEFEEMIKNISSIICSGSEIVFDYPSNISSKETLINEQLADSAGEKMKSRYSFEDIENILNKYGLEILKHLDDKEITNIYFSNYNKDKTNKIIAPKGVNYCLCIKKE